MNSCGECASEFSCNPAAILVPAGIAGGLIALTVILIIAAIVGAAISAKKVLFLCFYNFLDL